MKPDLGLRAQRTAHARTMALRADEQDAAMHLAVVLPKNQASIDVATAEVEHRQALFEARYRASTYPMAGTPKAAALRSVAHDIMMGWLT